MLTALKRGPSSILRLSRTGSSFSTTINKSPPIFLSLRTARRSADSWRWLSTTPKAQYYVGAQAGRRQRYDRQEQLEEIIPTASAEPQYTKFQELADAGLVDSNVIRQITQKMGHETMTSVQAMTIIKSLEGTDTIAQARTGTGKTLGFLIPVVQNIITNNPSLANPMKQTSARTRASDIRAIIISPTRELAEQITVEARKITQGTGVIVQAAVGGNSKSFMLRQMQRQGCHLLVATPGRLNDLLSDPYSKVAAPDLSALVLDEADRLLDAGFAEDIKDIITLLPDISTRDRQTMMFSATVPKEVMGLVRRTLKPDFQFVQTILKGELSTHERVSQKVVEVAGMENLMPALVELCKKEIGRRQQSPDLNPFKAIVYFNSKANVELSACIMENLKSASTGTFGPHPLMPAQIFEMHGKLTQEKRTRVSEGFRRAQSAIMLSSDVTARGMDFPNVTHVIQIGLPMNSDTYIHRLGRTGRAGKEGEGWIFLVRQENHAASKMLRNIPIVPDTSLEAASVDMTRDAQLPAALAETLGQVANATKMVPRSLLGEAYNAALATMKAFGSRHVLTELAKRWSRYGWGLESPPGRSDVDIDESNLYGGAREAFGGDRGSRGRSGYGGYGDRGGRSGQRGYGDRGDRGDRGGRSGYGGYGDRGDRGGRSGYGSYGDRGDRGDRSSFSGY